MKVIADDFRLIKKPTNYNFADSLYFETHYKNILLSPELKKLNNVFYSQSGILLSLIGNKNKLFLPFSSWGKNLNQFYWLKRIIKGIVTFKVSWKVKNNYNYLIAANPLSNNYFHWITEVIPKLIISGTTQKFTLILPNSFKSYYQVATLQHLGINHLYFDDSLIYFRECSFVTNLTEYPGY